MRAVIVTVSKVAISGDRWLGILVVDVVVVTRTAEPARNPCATAVFAVVETVVVADVDPVHHGSATAPQDAPVVAVLAAEMCLLPPFSRAMSLTLMGQPEPGVEADPIGTTVSSSIKASTRVPLAHRVGG